jgi:hypothetical protein
VVTAVIFPARVWDLGAAAHGSRLRVHVGDRLLVRGAWAGEPDCAVPPGVEVLDSTVAPAGGTSGLQLDVLAALETESVVEMKSAVDGSTWSVVLAPTPTPNRGLLSADRETTNERHESGEAR